MKIYAIRDRLIDYYLRPFAAESDKEVIASIAQGINDVESKTPISQAPNQFEIWRLAEVDQDSGIVIPFKEHLANCGSLVRDVRPSVEQRRAEIDRLARGSEGPTGSMGGEAGTNDRPLQVDAPPGGRTAPQSDREDPGSSEIDRHRVTGRIEDTEAYKLGYTHGAADS